jgi:hypothetical protein
MKPDNNNIGNAGEYYFAAVLLSKGYVTTINLGRAEKYDIIAIRPDGKTLKVQVKTAWYDNKLFRLSPKDHEKPYSDHFYAFVTLKENKKEWEYYVVPAEIVARSVDEEYETWLKKPGKNGQKHNENTVRVFRVKPSKDSSAWFTQGLIDSYKNNIEVLAK